MHYECNGIDVKDTKQKETLVFHPDMGKDKKDVVYVRFS